MTDPDAIPFDRDAVNRKYAEERSKRVIEGRAATRDLNVDEHFSSYRDDPFTPYIERDPIDDEVDVAIIGAGTRRSPRGRRPARQRASSASGSSTAREGSAAPGTGTGTRA